MKQRRDDGRPSVCLSMIVKDETRVLERCLDSVKPFLDAWAIVDTGSSDGTQDLVRELLADLPGELVERPWVDFAHNRNEALDVARKWGDYAFVIDADEELRCKPGFRLPKLTASGYRSRHRGARSEADFQRLKLVRCASPWRYEGVLHEVLVCDSKSHSTETLEGMLCIGHFDSARNQLDKKEKYARDAEVLERALEKEPDNARYVFYLAQSYRDAGERGKAIEIYAKRAVMGGWEEEAWYALYQVGCLQLDEDMHDEGTATLLRAFERRPTRVEPLCVLAKHHRQRGEHQLAYLYARRAVEIWRPDDILFINAAMYNWRALDELSIAAYWIDDHALALQTIGQLLTSDRTPPAQRARIEKNRDFSLKKLGRK